MCCTKGEQTTFSPKKKVTKWKHYFSSEILSESFVIRIAIEPFQLLSGIIARQSLIKIWSGYNQYNTEAHCLALD